MFSIPKENFSALKLNEAPKMYLIVKYITFHLHKYRLRNKVFEYIEEWQHNYNITKYRRRQNENEKCSKEIRLNRCS